VSVIFRVDSVKIYYTRYTGIFSFDFFFNKPLIAPKHLPVHKT